jgi:hypothetical protein
VTAALRTILVPPRPNPSRVSPKRPMQIPISPALAAALARYRAAMRNLEERKGAPGLLPAFASPTPPEFQETARMREEETSERPVPATPHGRGEECPGLAALRICGGQE